MVSKLNFLQDHIKEFTEFIRREKRYAFKRKPNIKERQKYELDALYNTLDRLLEDFKLKEKGKELIYVVDSSEFMGYVNPDMNIEKYVFKITGDDLKQSLLQKKAKWRKYRYEVLFGMMEQKSSHSIKNCLLHPSHFNELVNYYYYLLSQSLPKKEQLKDYLLSDNIEKKDLLNISKEDVMTLMTRMKDEAQYIDVFRDLTKKANLIERFNDLKNEGNHTDIRTFKWDELGITNNAVIKKLENLEYNINFYECLNYPFDSRSKQIPRNRTLRIDNKVLAFICTANQYLVDTKYRLALLSSSKLITNYTRYLLDFITNKDGIKKEISGYFHDVLYVRYPTVLINNIKHQENSWEVKSSIEKELMPIIKGVINKLDNPSITKQSYNEELKEIAEKWEKLRDNFLIEENFEDVEEQVDVDISAIYRLVFEDSEQLLNDLVDSYLYQKIRRLAKGFNAILTPINNGSSETGYFIRSTHQGTSQYVYQIPSKFRNDGLIIKENNTVKIETSTLDEYKLNEKIYYKYACILFACIQKDWEIVKTVSSDFIEKYESSSNIDLIEEAYYFCHLSMRFDLFYQLSKYGFSKNIRFDFVDCVNKIDNHLNSAIKLNKNNPRLQLSDLSFALEKMVFQFKWREFYGESMPNIDEDYYSKLLDEFKEGHFLKKIQDNFNKHYFKDNLYLMYYKVLLSFYLFCKTNKCKDQKETLPEEKVKDYSENLKARYNDLANENQYSGTKFIIDATSQLLNEKYDLAELELSCKNLPKFSFLRRFIARPVKDYIETKAVNPKPNTASRHLWSSNK